MRLRPLSPYRDFDIAILQPDDPTASARAMCTDAETTLIIGRPSISLDSPAVTLHLGRSRMIGRPTAWPPPPSTSGRRSWPGRRIRSGISGGSGDDCGGGRGAATTCETDSFVISLLAWRFRTRIVSPHRGLQLGRINVLASRPFDQIRRPVR